MNFGSLALPPTPRIPAFFTFPQTLSQSESYNLETKT